MFSTRTRLAGGLPLVILLTPIAEAQVASAIVRVGDAPAGTGVGVTVSTISGTAANEVGGVFVRTNLSNTNAGIWGNANGLNGSIVREEQLGIAGYDQTAFEGFFGGSDLGALSYSPTCTDLSTLVAGLDCVWLDSTPIAVAEQPIPTLPGKKFRFASRPGITGSGIPYWVSGISDIATNASEGQALFLGASSTIVLKPGDPSPAPLVSVLGASAGDFDARFSRNATHYINMITTTDATTADTHIVVDGAIVLDAGGNRLSELTLVSVAAGGNGVEAWQNWGSLGVNEAGDWMVEGDTSGATATDAFIAKNGVLLYREGSIVGGLTLTGAVLSAGAYMNEAGDIGYAWDTTGSITGIFLNSTLLLKEGDAVDFDNDGIVEPTSIFKATTGISSLVLGNTHLFVAATVTDTGVDKACLLAIPLPNAGQSFCSGDGSGTACPCGNAGLAGRGCANSTFAAGARLTSSGHAGASVGTDTLTLTANSIPGPGLFFQGTGQFASGAGIVFGDGLLCAGGTITRLGVVFPVGNAATFPGGLTPNPIHIAGATAPGDVRHYQCWYRDSALFCAVETYNLTQGLTVTWGI